MTKYSADDLREIIDTMKLLQRTCFDKNGEFRPITRNIGMIEFVAEGSLRRLGWFHIQDDCIEIEFNDADE